MVLLPDSLALGPVELTVTDLARSLEWYERALGIRALERDADAGRAGIGSDEVVAWLVEQRDARPAGRHAGLYHYCLLYPSRAELARAALRLAATRTPVTGMSDHETHEAIYLDDPDGNGIELAADRPREQWPPSLGYAGGPKPLDIDGLMEEVRGEEPTALVADGLRVGHLHLHVGDIDEGLAFYRDRVGFDEKAMIGTAAFVSAGGYHHHLGFNVWKGRGVPAVPPGAVGLRHWTVVLPPDAVEGVRERAGGEPDGDALVVHDPWGNAMRVVSSPPSA